ncbi:MAG: hypothetical protein JWL85_138, partial [Candidatus Saccharibacteria bacterium]|nr:hypothetical protein [Candidatus Saccharibacteria bacterium]
LYVETYFNRKHDSDRILNILIGNRPTTIPPETQKNMKMAYVGMTRATHLVCFAIHKSRITQEQIDSLIDKWDIDHITDRQEMPF